MAEIRERRPKRIFFYDDNLAANRGRLKTMLQMMIDEGLQVSWSAQVRTDVARDPELLELMRRSGCWCVYLGLESISQATLDSYEKAERGRHRHGRATARARDQQLTDVRWAQTPIQRMSSKTRSTSP